MVFGKSISFKFTTDWCSKSDFYYKLERLYQEEPLLFWDFFTKPNATLPDMSYPHLRDTETAFRLEYMH